MGGPGADRRFLPAAAAILVAWFGVLAVAHHRSFPPGTIPLHAALILAALLVLAAAAGFGRPLVRRALGSDPEAPLSWVLAIGAGLGAMELAVLAALALHLASPFTAWGIVLAGTTLLILGRGPSGSGGAVAGRIWREAVGARWPAPALALAGVGWVAALGAALAPAEFYDALIYHLAVPDCYVSANAVLALPGNFYAQYPANQGMLYALGMLLVPGKIPAGSLAQLLHLAAGAAAVAATFAAGARHLSPRAGLLAACLVATVPGVLLTATYPIADLAATFDGALAAACLLEAGAAAGARLRKRWALLAGVFAGLALGTKYAAALTVFLPGVVWLLTRCRRLEREKVADLGGFVLAAAAVFAPWAIRNGALWGNPVAPYLSGLLGAAPSGPSLAEEVGRRLPEGLGAAGFIVHWLSGPWRAGTERLGWGGYLGAAFWLLIPFAALGRPRPPALGALAALGGAALAFWSAGVQVTRYLFPAIPVLALLAAHGAAALARSFPALKEAAACAVGWILLHNVYVFLVLAAATGPYGAVLGVQDPEEYLARRVAYYPAAAFLNAAAPPSAKVLLVGEGRGYYLEREYAGATPFDPIPLVEIAEKAVRAGRPLAAALRGAGFTHLLVGRGEMERIARMRGEAGYFARTGPAARDAIERLLSGEGARAVFERSGVVVMEISAG
jgi:hypothetical protein